MMHKSRVWSIRRIESAEELASKLSETTWCCRGGFAIGDYLFLNDATGADGAQEYAVLKTPKNPGEPHRQIESITASWMTRERLLAFIRQTLAGENDHVPWAVPVAPILEPCEAHGRCRHCA